jgi:hypothetical protein
VSKITKFFYSFDVLPENEGRFLEYMDIYGNPIMSKYCKNWQFFKRKIVLTGENIPLYIGYFEIENTEDFLSTKPPQEMQETIEQAAMVSSNTKEWIGIEVAEN